MRLVELFAGSAAVTLRALGHPRRLVPYMGSKWPHADAVLNALGVSSRPEQVLLVDAGPWGDTWAALCSDAERVRARVAEMAEHPDHVELWAALRAKPVPACPVERAAVHLVMSRLAFRGKPLSDKGGRWSGPGLSMTEAVGVPATEAFGEVKPMLPSLARRLMSMPGLERVTARRATAASVEPRQGDRVYLDPPYVGTTGYGDGCTRAQVVGLARRWAGAGCTVVVSEAEPIDMGLGWRHVRLGDPRAGMGRPRQEWLTCWGKPAQGRLFAAREARR